MMLSLVLHAQTQTGNVNELTKKQTKQVDLDAQSNKFQKENLRFGGNFGLSFGTITVIDISPMVGYQFTRMIQAGMGFIYNYYADNRFSPRFSLNVFGVNPYIQFSPIQKFFLRGEYGLMNYNTNFSPFLPVNREWVHYPLVGGGFLLPVGGNGGISASLMWNLNDNDASIYGSNPIIRLGFMLGL